VREAGQDWQRYKMLKGATLSREGKGCAFLLAFLERFSDLFLQVLGAHRFYQVGEGSGRKAVGPIRRFISSTGHDDGKVNGIRILSKGVYKTDPIQVRHRPIQHKKIRKFLPNKVQRHGTIGRFQDPILALQPHAKDGPDVFLIVCDQNSLHGGFSL
jgi:hypothetical protein